jgi:Type II secretion system (T2SS), protein E, N-terminal domain
MQEAVTQTIGQQKEMASYQTVKHSQDMATVIREAVAMRPSHFSQFALVTVEFHFAVVNNPSHVLSITHERSVHSPLNTVRIHTRKSDLAWLKDTTCYFLLAGAGPQGGDIVQHRLWKALQQSIRIMQENTTLFPSTMTIGHSTYPEPCATIEQCLSHALMPHNDDEDDVIQVPEWPKEDVSTLARQFGVPYLPFLPRTFPNKVKRLVKPELAQELHCFPLGCAQNTLTVAMSNPQDTHTLDRLQQETGMRIFPVLIHPDELQNALEHITTS